MVLVIALAIWALAALPIAVALGRLCRETRSSKTSVGQSGNSADDEPGKRLTV